MLCGKTCEGKHFVLEHTYMKKFKLISAAIQFFLLLPAVAFMVALLVIVMPPFQSGGGLVASQVVDWYSGHVWTVWVLLIALPLVSLFVGVIAAALSSHEGVKRPLTDLSGFLMAVLNVTGVSILVIVGIHMLTN